MFFSDIVHFLHIQPIIPSKLAIVAIIVPTRPRAVVDPDWHRDNALPIIELSVGTRG